MQFYSSLLSNEPIDLPSQQRCLGSVEKFLSPSESISCKGFLSSEELLNSIRFLNTGKSPGSHGLSVEFYLHFWKALGLLLLCVANRCFADGELCPSMKDSVVRCSGPKHFFKCYSLARRP